MEWARFAAYVFGAALAMTFNVLLTVLCVRIALSRMTERVNTVETGVQDDHRFIASGIEAVNVTVKDLRERVARIESALKD